MAFIAWVIFLDTSMHSGLSTRRCKQRNVTGTADSFVRYLSLPSYRNISLIPFKDIGNGEYQPLYAGNVPAAQSAPQYYGATGH
jgi:hypothetical protein